MGQPLVIHSSYAGMSQDYARDQMPPNSVWNLVDYFPNVLGAPLRKRGGTVYASSAISATTFLKQVMYGQMDFGGSQLLAIDSVTSTSAGEGLWLINETTGAPTFIGSVTSASAGTATGSATVGDPVFYGKQWFIPIGYTDNFVSAGSAITSTSSMLCTVYSGTAMTKITLPSNAVSGGPSGARYAAVYRNRVALANTPYTPRRIWFNEAGDKKATKFTNKDAWLDMPMHITGMAALPTSMVVMGADRSMRIRGSIPPPGSDFVVDELSDQGCIDSRSIAVWNGKCVYANTNGVILTDGIDTVDMTAAAGLSKYYRDLLLTFTSAWRLRGEVFRNYYFLSIADANNALIDCLVCDLRSRAFFRFSNMNFTCMAVGTGTNFQQFYATTSATNRIVRLTDIFSPAATNKADADGTVILPVVELPSKRGFIHVRRRYLPTQGLTLWKRLYLTYDIRDAAADNPTLQLSYVETPEATSYTTFAKSLAETTLQTRGPFDFGAVGERGGKIVDALGLKITQTAASSDTRIYELEAENDALEGSR